MSQRNPVHPVLRALGRNVRRRRELLNFTQAILSEKSDIDQTYLSGIECGKRNPGIKNIARIAKALETTISQLVEGVGE
ncbi:MAG TPA: helix-turn-helix transcriptional regulator [Verrucomicrobiae bacterium]|jgi:transcriptional regulator with XRE-family HTH domain